MQNTKRYREILLRPQTAQFFIDELPLLLLCPVALVYGGMEDVPLASIATLFAVLLSLFLTYRLVLPETHTLPHRKRATDSRAWRVPTQHRVHRAVPCRGFPRAPDPVAADFRIKDRHRPVDGQKHAQTGTDRLAQTDSHRGHHQGTGRV